jgi:hypothetical protein
VSLEALVAGRKPWLADSLGFKCGSVVEERFWLGSHSFPMSGKYPQSKIVESVVRYGIMIYTRKSPRYIPSSW